MSETPETTSTPKNMPTLQSRVNIRNAEKAEFHIRVIIPKFIDVIQENPRGINLEEAVTVLPDKFKCQMNFFPNGHTAEDTHSKIVLKNELDKDVWICYKISILDSNFHHTHVRRTPHVSQLSEAIEENWFCHSFLGEDLETLLPGGALQICIYGIAWIEKPGCDEQDSSMKLVWKSTQMSQDCDVVISVGGQKFKGHKFILTSKSKYFSTLNTQSSYPVYLPSMKAKIFKEVFFYMYTEFVSAHLDNPAILPYVLIAANQLEILDLKKICELKMCKIVDGSNVLPYLQLAVDVEAYLLKEVCMAFIFQNKENLGVLENWEELQIHNPALSEEIIKKMNGN